MKTTCLGLSLWVIICVGCGAGDADLLEGDAAPLTDGEIGTDGRRDIGSDMGIAAAADASQPPDHGVDADADLDAGADPSELDARAESDGIAVSDPDARASQDARVTFDSAPVVPNDAALEQELDGAILPLVDAAASVDAAPIIDAAPVVDAALIIDAAPVVDAAPIVDAAPVVDATPLVDAAPVVDAAPLVDAAPVVDATPLADAALVVDAALIVDAAPADPPVHPLSDEFGGPAVDLLGDHERGWSVLHPDRAHSVDIDEGRMRVVAENPSPRENWAWFGDRHGPLVYQLVEGNFAVVAHFRVSDDDEPQRPPSGNFNAGGFVIRDPAGTHSGDEDWVMYNLGTQGRTGYSREVKKTMNSASGLYLTPQAFGPQALAVCRVGDSFRFWYWNDGWQPERFVPQMTEHFARAWPEIDRSGERPMVFIHDAMPVQVQVGVMAHAWETDGPGDQTRTRADIDYVRFAVDAPADFDDCPAAFGRP